MSDNRDEWNQRISATMTGVPKTEEHRQSMSDAKSGVAKTIEHRKNIRDAIVIRSNRIRQIQHEYSCSYPTALEIYKEQKRMV